MKTAATLLALALVSAVSAQAQLFRPETVTGAVVGGIAGAVIGHNDGRHGWEGAAYGATAGAVIGTIAGHARDRSEYRATQVRASGYRADQGYRGPHHPVRVVSVPRYYGPRYVHRAPVVYAPRYPVVYAPRYVSSPVHVTRRPSHTRTGVLLGGIAGAIIGHNDGRHGWEGAAYGIGAGYILGSIADRQAAQADAEARAYEDYRAAAAASAAVNPAPAPAAAPQQVTINNYYYGSSPAAPMAGANSLFGR
jgi:outer membrane lipoprotein SlyB